MKKALPLVFLIFIPLFLFSQHRKIDSLKILLKNTKQDTVRLNAYKELSLQFTSTDIEIARKYNDSLINYAIQKKLSQYELTGYSAKGILEFRKGNFKKSLEIWKHALKHPDIDAHPIQKGNLYHNISVGYSVFKENDSVQVYSTLAANINEKLANVDALIAIYGFKADTFMSTRQNDSSYLYFNKLLKLSTETSNEKSQANIYTKLATLSRIEYDYENSTKQYQKAIEIYQKVDPNNLIILRGLKYEVAKNKELDKKYEEALIDLLSLKEEYFNSSWDENFNLTYNTSLLLIYICLNKLEKAEIIYNHLLNKTKNKPESFNINLYVNLNLSLFEITKGIINLQTKPRLMECLKHAKNINDMYMIHKTYNTIAKYYQVKGNFAKAHSNLLLSNQYLDSLNSIETKTINLAQKRKFNEIIKTKENQILKQQNTELALLSEKQRNQKWGIISGFVLSLIALVIFFFAYHKNKKQKKKIEEQKNLVEKLQRELHHRLKNNLSFIDFFITLAKGKFPDPAYRAKLDELQNRINSMFEVHKQLFKKEDLTSVNAKTYISSLVDNVSQAYTNPHITLEINVKDTNLRADTSFPIGLIVNEFITNSYKYAFPSGKKGIIFIKLDEQEDKYLLQLSDNGKGLSPDFNVDNLNSFGMETIKLLTQEYKGTFKLNGNNGTRMDITFPK